MRANAAASAGGWRIDEGLRADREHLHVDLGRRHVLQAALQVPAAAREMAVDVAGDVEGAELIVDVGELRRHLGRLALQQPDGLFRQDVGVNVDRLWGRFCGAMGPLLIRIELMPPARVDRG